MAEQKVLFCPFCRECFEDQQACPEHELTLVPFAKLPATDAPEEEHEEEHQTEGPAPRPDRLGAFDPRYGRGWVGLGTLCIVAAWLSPLLRRDGEPISTQALARTIPSLWTLLLLVFTVVYTLARRRSLLGLRSLRVVIPALGGVALVSLLWVFFRLGFDATPALGSYLVGAGALLLVLGGLRLGGA